MKKRRLKVLPVAILVIFVLFLAAIAVIIIRNNSDLPMPEEYADIIEKVAYEEGIAEHILYAVIYTESSFRKDVVSSADAVGLMQLLPDTARWICDVNGMEYREELLTDPEFNITCGAKYLMLLYDRYKNWDAAHAAYHAGFMRVDEWISNGTVTYNSDGQLTCIPLESTEQYVNKIRVVREQYFKQLQEKKK